jgi:hypothetical protein
MVYVGGNGTRIHGGKWKVAHFGSRQFDVEARNCRLDGCVIEHSPDADTVQMYVRYGADGFQLTNCHVRGANEAVYIEASDVLIMGNAFDGAETVSGDDCIPIKAIQGFTENIRVIGNRFRNHASFVSIGSQVGTPGANDPSYSRQVRNVVIAGNSGEACTYMLYIKPGAISSIDYRDGIVEGIVLSDNTLFDLTGKALNRAVAITAARGCLVRNVKGKNNLAIGRCKNDGSGLYAGMHLFNIDHSAVSPGCNVPSISDVDVQITVSDPHEGIAGGGAAPGAPFNYGVNVENQTPTHGKMKNIRLDVSIDGTWLSGINVGAGLDDAVSIKSANLSSVNRSGSSTRAGIALSSRIELLSDDVSINMAAGNPYRLENGTTAEILGRVEQVFFAEQVNSGNDQVRRPWAAPRRCYLTKVELLSDMHIAQSTDDSNYTQFEFRNVGGTGNIFSSTSSKLTGGQAFPANAFNTVVQARSISSPTQQADCYFPKDAQLYVNKNDFGSGNTVRNAYMRVHWAPY